MATIADMANLKLSPDAASTVTLEERVIAFHETLVDRAADEFWEDTTSPLAGNISGYVGRLTFSKVATQFLKDQGVQSTDHRFEFLIQALADAGSKHALFRMVEPGRTGSYTNRAPSTHQLTTLQTWVVAAELPKSLTDRKKRPHSPMTTNAAEKTVTEPKPNTKSKNQFYQTPGVKPPWLPANGRVKGARNKTTQAAFGLVESILLKSDRPMLAREIFEAVPTNFWPFDRPASMPRLLEAGGADGRFCVRTLTEEDVAALTALGVKHASQFKVGTTLVACAKPQGVQIPGQKRGKTPPPIQAPQDAEKAVRVQVAKDDKKFWESPEVQQALQPARDRAAATLADHIRDMTKSAVDKTAKPQPEPEAPVLGVVQGGDDLMERAQKALEASQASLETANKVKGLEDEVAALKAENKKLRKMVDNLVATNVALRDVK